MMMVYDGFAKMGCLICRMYMEMVLPQQSLLVENDAKLSIMLVRV